MGGGDGVEFFFELLEGELVGGIGEEAGGWGGGGEVVFSGVLTRAGFAFWGARACGGGIRDFRFGI